MFLLSTHHSVLSTMLMKRSPLLVIFVTVFINLIGFGIFIPLLPFYARSPEFNASPRTIGLLFASYSIMQFLFSPVLGRLSDRYGRRPLLLLSMVGTGISFLILGTATTVWMLFAGRILDGITGGNISIAQAYVADVTRPEERAKGMGLIGAAFGLGFTFGPLIGGTLSRWGISVPFFFAAGLSFVNAALIYFMLPESLGPEDRLKHAANADRKERRQQLLQPRLIFVLFIYFLFVVAFSIMTTVFALYTMYRFDYDAQANGYLLAFIGVIAVIIQGGLIGRLTKLAGELRLIIVGLLLLALSLLALPFIGPAAGGLLGLLGVLAVIAVGNSLATPTLTSLVSKSVNVESQGGALGLAQSTASLARVVGPVIGAFLIHSRTAPQNMDDGSLLVTFLTAAGLAFAALLLALYVIRSQTMAADHRGLEVAAPSA